LEIPAAALRWVRPAGSRAVEAEILLQRRDDLVHRWSDGFTFKSGDESRPGLRTPQVGALHALLAHWTVADDTANVVMPTGTGKTETMIAALVAEGLLPLLVVVPSRALRWQLSRKFLTLGVLPSVGVLPADTPLPTVATIDGAISAEQLPSLLACDVLVTTMAGIIRADATVRAAVAEAVSHLFIDEAHHVPARTWSEFREAFSPRRVAQFTATPFRSDGKLIPGKVIYRYPLRKAQQEGYFRSIRFRGLFEFDPDGADRAIAAAALEQLASDRAAGLDHILMARVQTIQRAESIATLYRALSPDGVVVVHSDLNGTDRKQGLQALNDRTARVVVCVDMLGEGYDLPALKIAALHDAHRGLGITLQFIGRFTRSASTMGDATIVANVANPRVESALDELYSQDADWNVLLEDLNEGIIGRQLRRIDFVDGFGAQAGEIPIQNLRPKMSTVVYRTPQETWRPANAVEALLPEELFDFAVNDAENVAFLVRRHLERVPWGDVATLADLIHDLVLLYFDPARRLLFIHSSDTKRLHLELAAAVAGEGVELIRGMTAFRALHGINRLVIANLGLKHALGRSVRFTMYAGANVNEGLTEQHFQNRTTSNLFGFGYEDGERASAGCSYKGRLWSYRVSEDLTEWVDWCRLVGTKLIDDAIDPASLLRTTMTMTAVSERPPGLVPLEIEWSENVWIRNEDVVQFRFGDNTADLLDVGLEMTDHSPDGRLTFKVFTDQTRATFELVLAEDGPTIVQSTGPIVDIRVGSRFVGLTDWFESEPPVIRFHNGQQLVRDLLFSAPTVDRPFAAEHVEVWDWAGVELAKESQGPARDPASIQRRVIEHLLEADFDIVFDDDGTNEAADVVAIRATEEQLRVKLVHCKFAPLGVVGNRVTDLYEVCGQAQRSVHWKGDRARLLDHLARREGRAQRRGRTRFEKGDMATLVALTRRVRYLEADFEIIIVQPGLSKAGLTDGQRDLLATTQLYLAETFAVPLKVIANA
jgi:superfamily II DNA or RNA helicase